MCRWVGIILKLSGKSMMKQLKLLRMLIIIHGNVKLYDTLSRLPLVANFFDSLIVCSRVDSSVVWNNGKSQPVVS